MSKKNKKNVKETEIENFYELKIEATDDLVAALKGETSTDTQPVTTNIAEITGEAPKDNNKKNKEFDPYKRDKLQFLPTPVKALFVKWWFAGAVFYFVGMGLGTYISDSLDLLVLIGLVLGLIVDVLVNPIFRMLESDKKEYNNYMMFPFPFKAFWTFFANIIYYVGINLLVYGLYYIINHLLNIGYSTIDYVYLPEEPLLFGVFAIIVDMAFIGVKDLIVYLVKRHKNLKSEEEVNV